MRYRINITAAKENIVVERQCCVADADYGRTHEQWQTIDRYTTTAVDKFPPKKVCTLGNPSWKGSWIGLLESYLADKRCPHCGLPITYVDSQGQYPDWHTCNLDMTDYHPPLTSLNVFERVELAEAALDRNNLQMQALLAQVPNVAVLSNETSNVEDADRLAQDAADADEMLAYGGRRILIRVIRHLWVQYRCTNNRNVKAAHDLVADVLADCYHELSGQMQASLTRKAKFSEMP